MPELPEVETIVRELQQPLKNRVVVDFRTDWPRHIATPGLPELHRRIVGRTVEGIRRRGKYLLISFDNDETLIIHLKMSGGAVDRPCR